MVFTSTAFLLFFAVVLALYWGVRVRAAQNVLLLVASYVFYGWVHPWFCLLIAGSTVVDYLCGLSMGRWPDAKKPWLCLSLLVNLGMLGTFKYFDFFAANVAEVASALGLAMSPATLGVMLPVGISFYTFQTLSYTIDVYRGELEPRRRFIDFAVFVSFFPQLVAGPIERAKRFLPQVESVRCWPGMEAFTALQLIVGGYLKKMVVADNVGLYVNEVFSLSSPSLLLLAVAALGFAVQIYADFSAYTDIARGTAKLLGFDLVVNFRSPYLALSPSDFWRRWHISFSSWIRDYIYIPLGGSRSGGPRRFFVVLLSSLGLSGLWHGAAWNFVIWGVYHAVLVFAYHRLGMGGRWTPSGPLRTLAAWAVMFAFTLMGWLIFRADDMGWLLSNLSQVTHTGLSGDELAAAAYVLGLLALYSAPMVLLGFVERLPAGAVSLRSSFFTAALLVILTFRADGQVDFIYFQF